jgi:hypothetical protein
MKLHNIILTSIVNEEINRIFLKESNEKAKLIRRLYKAVAEPTSHVYRDEGWQGVDAVDEAIDRCLEAWNEANGTNLESEFTVENGGYRTSNDGLSKWKEYHIAITDDAGNIVVGGQLVCSFCGSVRDPMDAYDCTVNFW